MINYDKILKQSGSQRKAATKLGINRGRFVKLWKQQLGLCNRSSGCTNEVMPNKQSCKECIDKQIQYYREKRKKSGNPIREIKPKSYYLEECKKTAKDNKGLLLNAEYINSNTKMLWQCKDGHRWKATPASVVYYKRWCPYCGIQKRSDKKRTDISTLQQHAKKLGGKLISETYKKNTIPVTWECKKGHKWDAAWLDILHKQSWCPCCFRTMSKSQQEVEEFLKTLVNEKLLINTRPLDGGLEVDIYAPELNFGIEYHGLVFHSERPVFSKKDISTIKKQHQIKFFAAKKQNIQLIQIFEDEWNNKQKIVKSIIKNKLNKSRNRIFARQCKFKKINKRLANDFFETNHIAGSVNHCVAFGLFYNNKLVSCMSLRHPFLKKYKNSIEIARFSSSLDMQIVGGFQKLLKRVKEYCLKNNIKSILTYSDLRFGEGNVYQKAGFEFIGYTKPNYFYEKYGIREGRFKHKKNNDPEFIKLWGNTEREQNNNNGWYAIYDAGSARYILNL